MNRQDYKERYCRWCRCTVFHTHLTNPKTKRKVWVCTVCRRLSNGSLVEV